jgi:hypothetical protein
MVSLRVGCVTTWSWGSLQRICDIGLTTYKFCYLLPFDLWTSYLARILLLQGCDRLFWESPSSTRIFNELQQSFQVWHGFINVSKSFSYNDFLSILATQGKNGWWYLITFWILERKLNWQVQKREIFFVNCPCKIRKPSTTRQEDFMIPHSNQISSIWDFLGVTNLILA